MVVCNFSDVKYQVSVLWRDFIADNKLMNLKISTYWKCQLIGWGSYSLYLFLIDLIVNPGGSVILIRGFVMGFAGLLFTHVLRWLFKRLGILEKTFRRQVLYLLLLNIVINFFTAIFIASVFDAVGHGLPIQAI